MLPCHLLKRVQVYNEDIDPVNTMLSHYQIINLPSSQETPVNFRMQRLYPAIHHLGKTGVTGNLGKLYAGFGKCLSGPA